MSALKDKNVQCCSVTEQDVDTLKLLVACALVLESHGKRTLGRLLVESVESGLSKSITEVEVDLKGLETFMMMA